MGSVVLLNPLHHHYLEHNFYNNEQIENSDFPIKGLKNREGRGGEFNEQV